MKTQSHLIFVQGKIEKSQRLSISLQQESITALERIEKSLKDNREADAARQKRLDLQSIIDSARTYHRPYLSSSSDPSIKCTECSFSTTSKHDLEMSYCTGGVTTKRW